jgi:ferritin-like metal-binding protein YciE
MANAADWVRQVVGAAQDQPMKTEPLLKSLEKHIGQGERAMDRLRDVLDYLDQQLIERNNGPAMRGLWAAVTDYLEKVQEARAAA